jgi:hypothetical protein
MTAPRISLSLLALLLLIQLPVQGAAVAAFSSQLTSTEFAGIGLMALTPAELAALDLLVAREVAAARQGRVTAFRGTFISRRTSEEYAHAGLPRLTAPGQAQLNRSVAAALAAQNLPAPPPPAVAVDTDGIEVRSALKPEVHGAVTLGYGWSREGSYRFGTVDTYYHDPQLGLTLGLGVGTARGSGLVGRGLGRDCWRY